MNSCSPPRRRKSIQPKISDTLTVVKTPFSISHKLEPKVASLSKLSPDASSQTRFTSPSSLSSPSQSSSPIHHLGLSGFRAAKASLSLGNTSTRILERDLERKKIDSFLSSHVGSNTPGSLYISGKPGTGKSALLAEIISETTFDKNVAMISINCMALPAPAAIFSKIYEKIFGGDLSSEKASVVLTKHFQRNTNKIHLLILDEIDRLQTKDSDVLYKIFEWPKLLGSNVILVGVANALDLTERIVPMLVSRGCAPELIHFQPYSPLQLSAIIERKVKDIHHEGRPVLDALAIKLCAAKVGACGGDLRCAINICRRALDIIELRPDEKQTKIILDVCSNTLENDLLIRSRALPLMQRLVLCAFYRLGVQDKEVKASMVLSAFQVICLRVSSSERSSVHSTGFIGLLDALECGGFVLFTKRAAEKLESKVKLRVPEADILEAFREEPLFAAILTEARSSLTL